MECIPVMKNRYTNRDREREDLAMKVIGVLVLILALIFLCTSIVYSEDKICFDKEVAFEVLVLLEKGDTYAHMVGKYELIKRDHEEMIAQYEEIVLQYQTQIDQDRLTITDLQDLMREKDKAHDAEIKEIKPSFFGNLLRVLGGVGLGILIGIILI